MKKGAPAGAGARRAEQGGGNPTTEAGRPQPIAAMSSAPSERPKSKIEWLMAGGTIAAAVAAIFSAYAAFRLESATFESQLYNQQVAAISALLQATDVTTHKLVDLFQIFHPLTNTPPSGDERKKMESETADVMNKLDLAVQTATLVIPANANSQVQNLLLSMQSFAQKALSMTQPTDGRADILQFVKSVQPKEVAIRKCASEELSNGHSIREQQFTSCLEGALRQLEISVQTQ